MVRKDCFRNKSFFTEIAQKPQILFSNHFCDFVQIFLFGPKIGPQTVYDIGPNWPKLPQDIPNGPS